MGEVDGLERGGMAQLGGAKPPLQLALLAGRPLGVDEQTEAFLEAESGGLVGLERRARRSPVRPCRPNR